MIEMQNAASKLKSTLHLNVEPIGISFSDRVDPSQEFFDIEMPLPTEDGRTGRVAAGCVFWMHAVERRFATVAADHANCSVGSFTHGFLELSVAATKSDVGALVTSGWVSESDFGTIEHVTTQPAQVIYEPLSSSSSVPDVVFLRLNARSAMIFRDAFPTARIEGKPQCHIVAIAKELGEIALSFGCMLSRTRTSMPSSEMTAAIPGPLLQEALDRLEETASIDRNVANYASIDSKRFAN
ncbi:hypothetical protein AXFE_21520 [Acidithrix ferrooxidans]|uniref:Uncharacterized protein n=2 Tax=Acidithrix ferrooxidans TaxID=1280514 RepID=A0A0D8HGX3_9ACTN|nr:hypothetical protein AXFE_21520 [Acidithrix ferrooxidans]